MARRAPSVSAFSGRCRVEFFSRRRPLLSVLALLLVFGFQGAVPSLVAELNPDLSDCGCGSTCRCRDGGNACGCARISLSMSAGCSCGGHGSDRILGPQVQDLILSATPALVAPRSEPGPGLVVHTGPAWLLPHELLHPA